MTSRFAELKQKQTLMDFLSLQVIINCVCAPDQSLNVGGAFSATPLRRPQSPINRVLSHIWQVVQNNNGIKVSGSTGSGEPVPAPSEGFRRTLTLGLWMVQVLLSLLSVKMPITDADQIRALACRALVGLSRSSAVRQIISKLPLLTSSHIQQVSISGGRSLPTEQSS